MLRTTSNTSSTRSAAPSSSATWPPGPKNSSKYPLAPSLTQGHDNTICAMDLSPSGTYLATAQVTFPSFVADVVVWNLNDF